MINWAMPQEYQPTNNSEALERVTLTTKQLASIGIYSDSPLYVTKDGAYHLDGEKYLGKRYRTWHWWWGHVAQHAVSYWDGEETWTRILGDHKKGHAGKFIPLRNLRLPLVVFGIRGTQIEEHAPTWCDYVRISSQPGPRLGEWVKLIDIQFDDPKSHYAYQTTSDSDEFTDGELLTALTSLILGFDRLPFTQQVELARSLRFRQNMPRELDDPRAPVNPGLSGQDHPCPETVLAWLNTQDNIPERFKKAYPSLHYCSEWDSLVIDRYCPEFESCSCFTKAKETANDDEIAVSTDGSPLRESK